MYNSVEIEFIRNQASLDVTNNTQETVIFEPKQMLCILVLRYLDYYKIRQGVLQQNLSKCYHLNQQKNYISMGSLIAIAHRPWSKYLAWGPVMLFTYTLQFFTIFLSFLR